MSNVKLILQWDIKPGLDQQYFEFVMQEWVPQSTKLGLQPIGAWYTVYSRDADVPRIMAEALADSPQVMADVLKSPEWELLQDKLKDFVDNYSHKVVRATGEFQL